MGNLPLSDLAFWIFNQCSLVPKLWLKLFWADFCESRSCENKYKKSFCKAKVEHSSGKFISDQFSLLNLLSMSSGSKIINDFVFELAQAGV